MEFGGGGGGMKKYGFKEGGGQEKYNVLGIKGGLSKIFFQVLQ